MSRYIGPVQKKLRSLGLESYGSIRRDEKKNVAVMGRRRRVSNYGLQLKEKQKARFLYGVQEKQFRKYYERALNMDGITGDNLMILLERRLDNVLYRSGMFLTRRQSRQAVNHGHFQVNGQKVDIPSYQLKTGDHITWTEKATKNSLYQFAIERFHLVEDVGCLVFGRQGVDRHRRRCAQPLAQVHDRIPVNRGDIHHVTTAMQIQKVGRARTRRPLGLYRHDRITAR